MLGLETAAAALLGYFGFSASGPVAGSVAASWMSSAAVANGGAVAAGSVFSGAQALAMGGGSEMLINASLIAVAPLMMPVAVSVVVTVVAVGGVRIGRKAWRQRVARRQARTAASGDLPTNAASDLMTQPLTGALPSGLQAGRVGRLSSATQGVKQAVSSRFLKIPSLFYRKASA
mmetsp:Transcript_13208/g.23257  ORF Transcript_13208/g.23257 Transcript_13208/m.23257 type:complete len:175 (-) Transcript_13208:361-885(-)